MNTHTINGTSKCLVLAAVLAGSLSACASMPAHKQAAEKLTTTAQLLTSAREAATAAGVTEATHRDAAQALAAALDAESKTAAALGTWKAGDPPPPALHDLVINVEAAQVAILQLTGDPSVMKIADLLQQASASVAAVQAALTTGS